MDPQPPILSTLAAACAEAGRYPEAVATAETAVNLAEAIGDRQCASAGRRLLVLYREGKPCRAGQRDAMATLATGNEGTRPTAARKAEGFANHIAVATR